MKTKVLSSYLILLSLYVIQASKIPDQNSSASLQTPARRSKLDNLATSTETTTETAVSPTTKSTKLPPKKYVPSTQKSPTNGPLKISLSKAVTNPPKKAKDNNKVIHFDELVCPAEGESNFQLFAPPCRSHTDCTAWDSNERCCKLFGTKNCIKGVPKPLEEQDHIPLLGLIPRKCPERPLAELWWELKTCQSDDDCWPRICCPDGRRMYCRTASPEYESVPPPIGRSIAYLSEYLECTPAPPPVFDLHPKECNSTLDCFPNICCQETGRKFCRPPKKSVLTVMANFLNIGLVKRLTRNLVIK